MKHLKAPSLPYRPCVAIMLINDEGKIFLGQRIDTQNQAWQMPQGGIDPDEKLHEAALRELYEETGAKSVQILSESQHWYQYDIPDFLQEKLWGGIYRGQTQKWFLMHFSGQETEFDLKIMPPGDNPFITHQEFGAWRWSDLDEVPKLAVDFKRIIYQLVIEEFKPLIQTFLRD